MTTCRAAWKPSWWGGTVSWPVPFAILGMLMASCLWQCGWGGGVLSGAGRANVCFLSYYIVQSLKLVIISNLKNAIPAPPLSNLRSRKHHRQIGTTSENTHTFGTGHKPTDHFTGCALTLELYVIVYVFLIDWQCPWQHHRYLLVSRLCGHPTPADKKAEGAWHGVQQRERARAPYFLCNSWQFTVYTQAGVFSSALPHAALLCTHRRANKE